MYYLDKKVSQCRQTVISMEINSWKIKKISDRFSGIKQLTKDNIPQPCIPQIEYRSQKTVFFVFDTAYQKEQSSFQPLNVKNEFVPTIPAGVSWTGNAVALT